MEDQIINLYENGEYESCIFLCEMQLQINDNSEVANDYLAHCLLIVGRYEESLKIFNKIINKGTDCVIDQDGKFAHYVFRGDCFHKLGYYDNALQDYVKALHILPKTGSIWQRVAEVYFEMGDFEEAHVNIDRAIIMSNRNRDTWVMKAAFFKFQGKDTEASRMFSEIRKVYPNDELIIDLQFEILTKTFAYDKEGSFK